LQISLVVPVIVQTNGTVRAEKIADTALDALILIPHRLVVAPVLIGSKIFCKGEFRHTHPILASGSVKRCKMSELNSTNKKKSQRIFLQTLVFIQMLGRPAGRPCIDLIFVLWQRAL
jgi:hypothetical protein